MKIEKKNANIKGEMKKKKKSRSRNSFPQREFRGLDSWYKLN